MTADSTTADPGGYTLWFRGRSGDWFPAAMTRTYAAAAGFAAAAANDWLILPAGQEPDPGDHATRKGAVRGC